MTRCGIVLFFYASLHLASSARLQTGTQASQQAARGRSHGPTRVEEVFVKKLRHSGWMESWDGRYLVLNEYVVHGIPTFKLEYSRDRSSFVGESFDICKDKVRAGEADAGPGSFQIFTTAGHKNYVFKPDKGSDLTKILSLIREKSSACNSQIEFIKEGTVMKKGHSSIISGFDVKFMVLRTVREAVKTQSVLEYMSTGRDLVPVTWDVCASSFDVANGAENTFIVTADASPLQGRKHASYTFRGIGATDDLRRMSTTDWITQIKKLQERCDADEEDVVVKEIQEEQTVLPSVPNMDLDEIEQDEPKAKLVKIDARTETMLQIKDMMIANKDKTPFAKTLVAFDFDLTLRDDHPDGGNMLRFEESTRELLEWLKANKAPAIVVTARTPSVSTWERTWKQAVAELDVADLLGQHVPPLRTTTTSTTTTLADAVTISAPETQKTSPCNGECSVIEYSWDYGEYTAKLKMVDGNGMVIAGYEKGAAILHYIKIHNLDITQVIFVDDYATNSVNVASACNNAETIERVVGIWLAPFDKHHGTKEFVDEINERTLQLKDCLAKEKFSECKRRKYWDASWCDPTVEGYLGDNAYSPRQPANLYNAELVHLGHFPTNEEERAGPEAALRSAQALEQEIVKIMSLCKLAEKKEIEDDARAEQQAFEDAGVLPPCTSTVKCMQSMNKPKPKCNVNAPACAHLL